MIKKEQAATDIANALVDAAVAEYNARYPEDDSRRAYAYATGVLCAHFQFLYCKGQRRYTRENAPKTQKAIR